MSFCTSDFGGGRLITTAAILLPTNSITVFKERPHVEHSLTMNNIEYILSQKLVRKVLFIQVGIMYQCLVCGFFHIL